MNSALVLTLAWLAGGALGTLFFGGLWWTINKVVSAKNPAVWFFVSLLLRMSIVLAGFYFVSGGQWQRLLLCLLGFIMARVVLTRLLRPTSGCQSHPAQEASDAP